MKKIISTLLLCSFGLLVSAQSGTLKIKITGNGYSDETAIRFTSGATSGFDGSYDAWKQFSPNNQVPSLYSELPTGGELSINSMAPLSKDTTIDLYALIPATGSYQVKVTEVHQFSPSIKVNFENLDNKTVYAFTSDTTYQFNLTKSVDSSAHFALKFNYMGAVTSVSNFIDQKEMLVKNLGGKLLRLESIPFKGNYNMRLMSVNGKLLKSEMSNSSSLEMNLNEFEGGVYILTLYNDNKRITRKIALPH